MPITAVEAWFESGDDISSGKEPLHSQVTASDAGDAWLKDKTSGNLCPVLNAVAAPTTIAIPNAIATAIEAAKAWIEDKADDETGPETDGTTGSYWQATASDAVDAWLEDDEASEAGSESVHLSTALDAADAWLADDEGTHQATAMDAGEVWLASSSEAEGEMSGAYEMNTQVWLRKYVFSRS